MGNEEKGEIALHGDIVGTHIYIRFQGTVLLYVILAIGKNLAKYQRINTTLRHNNTGHTCEYAQHDNADDVLFAFHTPKLRIIS